MHLHGRASHLTPDTVTTNVVTPKTPVGGSTDTEPPLGGCAAAVRPPCLDPRQSGHPSQRAQRARGAMQMSETSDRIDDERGLGSAPPGRKRAGDVECKRIDHTRSQDAGREDQVELGCPGRRNGRVGQVQVLGGAQWVQGKATPASLHSRRVGHAMRPGNVFCAWRHPARDSGSTNGPDFQPTTTQT